VVVDVVVVDGVQVVPVGQMDVVGIVVGAVVGTDVDVVDGTHVTPGGHTVVVVSDVLVDVDVVEDVDGAHVVPGGQIVEVV